MNFDASQVNALLGGVITGFDVRLSLLLAGAISYRIGWGNPLLMAISISVLFGLFSLPIAKILGYFFSGDLRRHPDLDLAGFVIGMILFEAVAKLVSSRVRDRWRLW